jgi:tRNA-2-methylthio-N6-dimethylallyladenosine synthase
LIHVQNQITVAANERRVGEEAELLVDGPARRGDGLLSGRTRTNKQVVFPGGLRLVGRLLPVHLTEAHLWGFTGEAV